ncbi:CheR family methyltransferase [Roseovarius aquimarinus]|uniref:protein-glutamate O-methyltransferase n=1 Tax=Roseovarius aquimarinus TaxID=1229156 RepID=A0ABW7I5D1_9RHOB
MSHMDQGGFEAVRDWISLRCGISYPPPKADLLRQRMGRVLRRFGYADLNRLAQELQPAGLEEVQLAVMHAASINHTYFFREPEILERFITEMAPALARGEDLRIWSAACSSGEEVYTIAMLLAQRMGPDVLRRVSILGTDISGPMVERAELGIFPERQFSQTDPAILGRWFTPTGIGQFRVRPALRDVCTFRRMNLKATPYPFKRAFHAIFCRNILYYFDHQDQAATVRALYDMAVPGGLLVTSVTESISHLGSNWQQIATGIFRRPA